MEKHFFSAIDQQPGYFKPFVQNLVNKFQPLQLFCFAQTKALTETNGCFKDSQHNHECNYCLLMVTESNTRIDHDVQDFINSHYQHGTISVICHGREAILEAIKANSRFYLTIYTTGQLLYSHDGMSHFDFTGKFIPTQSATKAQKHFDHRMPLAEGFLRSAGESIYKQDYSIAVFLLHQAVEQCAILLLRVNLAYRSEIHNLTRMLRLCEAFSEKPLRTFLTGSIEDERLFSLLMKNYTGSRYGNGFSVTPQDVESIFQRVSSFATLVREMCMAKIEELEHEAQLYSELKEGSEVKVD